MLSLSENLIAIEQHFNFKYPPSFVANIQTLISLSQTPNFSQFMPQAQLLLTVPAIETAFANGLPREYMPFLLEKQPNHLDFYIFDSTSKSPELSVGVFAIHTLVAGWDSFEHFLNWLKTCLNPD